MFSKLKTAFCAAIDTLTCARALHLAIAVLYAGECLGLWSKEVSQPLMVYVYSLLGARGH